MSQIAAIYEKLQNNNLALEAIQDLVSSADAISNDKLYYLISLITQSNNSVIEQLLLVESSDAERTEKPKAQLLRIK